MRRAHRVEDVRHHARVTRKDTPSSSAARPTQGASEWEQPTPSIRTVGVLNSSKTCTVVELSFNLVQVLTALRLLLLAMSTS